MLVFKFSPYSKYFSEHIIYFTSQVETIWRPLYSEVNCAVISDEMSRRMANWISNFNFNELKLKILLNYRLKQIETFLFSLTIIKIFLIVFWKLYSVSQKTNRLAQQV